MFHKAPQKALMVHKAPLKALMFHQAPLKALMFHQAPLQALMFHQALSHLKMAAGLSSETSRETNVSNQSFILARARTHKK